jgi:hypothetical protein
MIDATENDDEARFDLELTGLSAVVVVVAVVVAAAGGLLAS